MPTIAPWVVVPTYNERDNIANIIRALQRLNLPNLNILIVDDSSPDGTGEIVRHLAKADPTIHLLVRDKKNGLGQAYIHGFTFALQHGASIVVQMDADFSHDPADIPRLMAALERADVVIGSRYSHGISVVNWPLRRLLISMAGNVYARLITGLPYKDVTGGFKVWQASVLAAIDLPSVDANGYSFQIITTHRAWRKGYRITEIPITFTERREGQSKMSNAIITEAMWVVWRLRIFGR
jgi:dolichol-phosphate mannosyltransferase